MPLAEEPTQDRLKQEWHLVPYFQGDPILPIKKMNILYIEDLLKATAIYAQSIYELAQVKNHNKGEWKNGICYFKWGNH